MGAPLSVAKVRERAKGTTAPSGWYVSAVSCSGCAGPPGVTHSHHETQHVTLIMSVCLSPASQVILDGWCCLICLGALGAWHLGDIE